ncbi:MAG TPA: DUF5591 domain-containing protein [Thermoplasmata archaeon]|nr:DUF5591 domain-containing protein [Thermoplasmata archaeon]
MDRGPLRTVECIEGLALLGNAAIGPLRIDVPEVAWATGLFPSTGDPARRLALTAAGPSVPGRRSLELRRGSETWPFTFPVPAPEVSGHPGALAELGPSAWAVRWPLAEPDWDTLLRGHPGLVILENARALWGQGEPFVRAVAEIRTRLGAAPVLWAPRTALPHRIALLALLSVDLVDSSAALWEAAEGVYLDRTLGRSDGRTARIERSCTCRGCTRDGEIDLAVHAVEETASEMATVRATIRSGRLRELAEARLTSEPALAEMLRYADGSLGSLFDERTPVVGTGSRGYVLREAFRRPEVARYRRRLLERYAPPRSKNVLLLLPCSRTKPYRNSPSHRRFLGAVRELPESRRLHFVSVTSPLGVVPRELEDLFPARHYDIPVTGDWDESERTAVIAGVEHLVRSGAYESVVAHLDPEEYAFLRGDRSPIASARWTREGTESSTSARATDALRRAAGAALAATTSHPASPLDGVRAELESIARMQFGRAAGERLMAAPIRLHGRPWFQRLSDAEGHDVATWQEQRGLFQLTVQGAQRIGAGSGYAVEVSEEVRLQGDLFTPGVRAADPQIRTGDAVVVVNGEEVRAVGEAALPGALMVQLPRGLAVRIRHRNHSPAGRAATVT